MIYLINFLLFLLSIRAEESVNDNWILNTAIGDSLWYPNHFDADI
ncbi:hypothetical protein HOR54_gp28 [Vibrio phage Vp670]|uniref:Uncharacterized protein n=1 Tax=Vibrio phage Vp670 TaxID=1932890 RepID=A0A1L7DQ23_9CAUD|nr:hypothetical protein HOR54_gp28 [Vibrio phage Vp670]APU00165.1 hypothetical protein QD07_28 [Vibrio phage Vp670]